jgi:hypothetical protein
MQMDANSPAQVVRIARFLGEARCGHAECVLSQSMPVFMS